MHGDQASYQRWACWGGSGGGIEARARRWKSPPRAPSLSVNHPDSPPGTLCWGQVHTRLSSGGPPTPSRLVGLLRGMHEGRFPIPSLSGVEGGTLFLGQKCGASWWAVG